MTTPGFERGGAEQTLPIEVYQFIERLDGSSVDGTSDAHIADVRLSFGPSDHEEILETIQIEVALAAAVYHAELAAFVRTGQDDYGIPAYALNRQGYSERPTHEPLAWPMDEWLGVVRKHDPESAHQTINGLVETVVEDFDRTAFESALGSETSVSDHGQYMIAETVKNGAIRTAESLATRIKRYATDANLARTFRDSPFFAAFGDDRSRLTLQQSIVKLEGHTSGDDLSEDYTEMLRIFNRHMASHHYGISGMEAIGTLFTIADKTPNLIDELAEAYPDSAKSIRMKTAEHLLNLDEEQFTDAHREAVEQIEAALTDDVRAYASIVHMWVGRTGGIDPTKLAHLNDLLRVNPDNNHESPLGYAASLVVTHTPDAELAQLLRECPYLTVSDQAKAIAVRRLARIGNINQAVELIDKPTTTIDSNTLVTNPIRNYLAIYEETGDEAVLAQADQRIEAYTSGQTYTHVTDLHEFAARRYVGARLHGDAQNLAAAELALREGNTAPEEWVRTKNLGLTIQMYLDHDDLETAARYVKTLCQDEEVKAKHADSAISPGHDAVMVVMNAYIQKGRAPEAFAFALPILFSESIGWRAVSAIELLHGEGSKHVANLYARHLDPMKSKHLE